MRKIENDEQLKKSLDWLLEKAVELEHPLLEGDAKAKLAATYDYVSDRVREYQQSRLEQKVNPAPPKPPVNLADWMDDDE